MKTPLILIAIIALATTTLADIVIYPTSISKVNCTHASGCPGGYCGYANYTKTVAQGWGWQPISSTNSWAATDTNRSNTKVQLLGEFGDNNCDQTTVGVSPTPPQSPAYRFAVFFTNNVPTTTNYPLVLHGFLP